MNRRNAIRAARTGPRLGARAACAGAALALTAPWAAGQAFVPEPSLADPSPSLRLVDQLVDDGDRLATSLRSPGDRLLVDDDFGRLFELRDPVTGETVYVRRAGAVHAVSPRTDYAPLRRGVTPVVSPGTVFFIGEPDARRAAAAVAAGAAPWASVREGASVSAAGVNPPVRSPAVVERTRPVRAAAIASPAAEGRTARATEAETEAPTLEGDRNAAWSGSRVRSGAGRGMDDRAYRAARLRALLDAALADPGRAAGATGGSGRNSHEIPTGSACAATPDRRR